MTMAILKIPFVLMLLVTTAIMAKEDSQYLLTEKTYKILSVAQDLMAKENYADAKTKLEFLLTQTTAGSYDNAVVLQTLGYLCTSQENYKQARMLFRQALDSHALPDKVSRNLQYNLAQLLLTDKQYNNGILLLEQWLKSAVSPPNNAYVLLASANYHIKQYKKTIEYINIAIKNDKSVKEAWYQVLLSAHLELNQTKSAIKVLETLITAYPYKKTYWIQLSSLYLQQNKEFIALAVQALAQRLELGDAKTLINLADMYRYLHIPYKSAQLLKNSISHGVIDENFENLDRLTDSWLAAKEHQKAIAILQRVTELDDSGESDLKYGRALYEMGQWQQAIKPLTKSIQKLDDDKVGSASLLLGMVYVHMDDLLQAQNQFTHAMTFESERDQAGQWLRYVDKQLEEQVVDEL